MIKIKNNFSKITDYETNIDNLLNKLGQKSLYLKYTYEQLLKENTTIDVITTDSFAFQNNILVIKIENNRTIYKKLSNQIYNDYYKLIRYIVQYVNNYVKSSERSSLDDTLINISKIIENIEPYKINVDSEAYSIKNSQLINDSIIDILETLNKNYKKQEERVKIREKKLNVGINIENYIDNIKHNNETLRHNIQLFNQFLSKYNTYHLKYLSTLQTEINNLYNNISQEIDFNNINFDKINMDNQDYSETVDKSSNTVNIKPSSYKQRCRELSSMLFKYFITIIKINCAIFSLVIVYAVAT